MRTVTTVSPAKLNLFLELHRRREDGFHDLETVMVAIDRCDRLRVRRRQDGAIQVHTQWSPSMQLWREHLAGGDPALLEIPQGPGNLAYQAVERFRDTFQQADGFDVRIEKTIPAGAGMGGASSNAASVLRAAAHLCDVPLNEPALWTIAAELGSDVPFFLGLPRCVKPLEGNSESSDGQDLTAVAAGGDCAALASGRGERLRRLVFKGAAVFVVCFPPQALSTAKVYAACQVPQQPITSDSLRSAMAAGDLQQLPGHFFNRLAEPARRLSAWIDPLLAAMRRVDLQGCQLTGSGSACFGLARSRRHARRSVASLSARGFPVSFFATPLSLPTPLQ